MKALDWGEISGHVSVGWREWDDRLLGMAFWVGGAYVCATCIEWPGGTVNLEFLMTLVQDRYFLGVTAMTWPTHESSLHHSGASDNMNTGAFFKSYREHCAPRPTRMLGCYIVGNVYSEGDH